MDHNNNNNNSTHIPEDSKIILQAYLEKFSDLKAKIPQIKKNHYTHIQISPVQSHCIHINEWYRVYQPVGSWGCIGNSLGNSDELNALVKEANNHNLKIIVDVVLHHYTGCISCNPSAIITHLPNQAWRKMKSFFIGDKAWERKRFEMDEWGPKQEMDNLGCLMEHVKFLTDLIEIGVKGFRFDAAKHIDPKYINTLCRNVEQQYPQILFYSEVLDGSVDVIHEYTDTYLAADFPLTFQLTDAFSYGKSLKTLQFAPCVNPAKAICLADCHDSILGDSYKFPCPEDGLLALCFLLGRGQAAILIPKLYETHPLILTGIHFFHVNFGTKWDVHEDSTDDCLVIVREKGVCIVNKSGEERVFKKVCGKSVKPREALFHFY